MKKTIHRLLSAVLVVLMSIGVLSAAAFADGEKKSYVALGDSFSQGYLFHDYNDWYSGFAGASASSYIPRFAEYLGDEYELTNLTIQGMRPTELYELFEPELAPERDWDADNHFYIWEDPYLFGSFDAMAEKYRTAVKNADIITFDLGMSEFGIFATQTIGALFSGEPVEVPSVTKYLDMLDEKALEQIEKVRAGLHNALDALAPDVHVADLIDTLLYAYASYLVNFNNCIDYIFRVNPDVELIVLPLYNPIADYIVSLTDHFVTVNLSTALDVLFESATLWANSICKYADRYKYAEYDASLPIFADELYYVGVNECSDDLKLNIGDKFADYIGAENFTALLNTINGDEALTGETDGRAVYNAYAFPDTGDTAAKAAIRSAFDHMLEVFKLAIEERTFPVANLVIGLNSDQYSDPAFFTAIFTADPADLTQTDLNYVHIFLKFTADARGFATHPAPEAMDTKLDAVIKAHESDATADGTVREIITEKTYEIGAGIRSFIIGWTRRINSIRFAYLSRISAMVRGLFSVLGRIAARG